MRHAVAVGISFAVVLAFMSFVPVAQVSFSQPPMTEACTNSAGQITSGCAHILVHGYGSITYWLFGTGGLYNNITSQYSFVL
jgi:hypothetical protein